MQQMYGSEDPSDAYAKACYYIEKVLHQVITPEYPVAKFLAQIEQMREDPEFKESAKTASPKTFR